jgi:MFS family permease
MGRSGGSFGLRLSRCRLDLRMVPPRKSAACVPQVLSPNVSVLGFVSLLMGMSSAMIYGVLPVFLLVVLGASTASVGFIEGIAEATTSLAKIFSGITSDRIRRRKPLVVLGYALSAVNKLLFPIAESASMVLLARMSDRVGKGVRDAPRDAFMTDMTPMAIRGSGFGLRLALYTIGAVLGPLAAMTIMSLSGDNFRLVFWLALIPGFMSVVVLLLWVKEEPRAYPTSHWSSMRRLDLANFPASFWWAIAIAAILSLARFSPAFLVLKAHSIHVDAALVPIMLVVMYLVYSAAAYPFGVLADHFDRNMQLGIGTVTLILANLVLAGADSFWMTMLGGGLWGLQMGVTQGLLAAAVADAAPEHMRGTAFGVFELITGVATFMASASAGLLWMVGGAGLACGAGAAIGSAALAMLLFRRRCSLPR